MSSLTFFSPFGYYPSSYMDSLETSQKANIKWMERRNYIGYIPLIGGQFAGISRWIVAAQKFKQGENSFAIAFIVRGTVEFLGLGLLVGLIDILVTLGRLLSSRGQGFSQRA